MAGVQEVEYAVGEDDLALGSAPGGRGVGGTNLRRGVQSGCVALGWKEKL